MLPGVKPEHAFENPPAMPEIPSDPPPAETDSLEMTIGRVWLVRIGIVILLTGLVFLGNLAFQQIIPMLGPGAKLGLIGLAGALLAGAGRFLEGRGESLRNYGRVVLAGGCATIYYTAYAAHFVAPLKIIASPWIGGGLLLALAVAIGWAADRRKSETLALVAVALSYYTAALNPIGAFTLFSSFLLSGTAVYFLLRHRWVRLNAVSLAGSYLSYAWCHFSGPGLAGSSLPTLVAFLAGYWIIFAAGAFLARPEILSPVKRASLLTLNNAAFCFLAGWEIVHQQQTVGWAFSLGFGLVLLALAGVARRGLKDSGTVAGTLATQGVILVLLGLAFKLTGQQFAFVLAAQSLILFAGASGRSQWLLLGGFLSALAAAGLATTGLISGMLFGAAQNNHAVALIVASVLLVDVWFWKRTTTLVNEEARPASGPALLVFISLALGWVVSMDLVKYPAAIRVFALAAVLCGLLPRSLRMVELRLLGQLLLPVGAVTWILGSAMQSVWSGFHAHIEPACMVAAGWILATPWVARRNEGDASNPVVALVTALSAGVVASLWVARAFDRVELMVAASVAGTIWALGAAVLRSPSLGASGLGLLTLAIANFFVHQHHAAWWPALAPVAAVASCLPLVRRVLEEEADAQNLSVIQKLILGVLLIMSATWFGNHVHADWRALIAVMIGGALTLVGAKRGDALKERAGLAVGVMGWAMAVFGSFQTATWQELMAVIAFSSFGRVARRWKSRLPKELEISLSWAAMTGVTLWSLQWMSIHASTMAFTILWTLLGLVFFGAGLLLKDRQYRLGGMALFGFAVARVFFIDVWHLAPVLRIVSFLLLGTALVVVGYFYNRFEAVLRKWL